MILETQCHVFIINSFSLRQLDEANALLRAESDAAARLRKTQTESSKQLQQLDAHVRELQDKCCMLENSKLSLERENISLQAALDTEKREQTQGSETISDLQGKCISSVFDVCVHFTLNIHPHSTSCLQHASLVWRRK